MESSASFNVAGPGSAVRPNSPPPVRAMPTPPSRLPRLLTVPEGAVRRSQDVPSPLRPNVARTATQHALASRGPRGTRRPRRRSGSACPRSSQHEAGPTRGPASLCEVAFFPLLLHICICADPVGGESRVVINMRRSTKRRATQPSARERSSVRAPGGCPAAARPTLRCRGRHHPMGRKQKLKTGGAAKSQLPSGSGAHPRTTTTTTTTTTGISSGGGRDDGSAGGRGSPVEAAAAAPAASDGSGGGGGADMLFYLRTKYTLLDKPEWWWLMDESVAEIDRRLAADNYVVSSPSSPLALR